MPHNLFTAIGARAEEIMKTANTPLPREPLERGPIKPKHVPNGTVTDAEIWLTAVRRFYLIDAMLQMHLIRDKINDRDRNHDGETPLMAAVRTGDKRLVQLVLAAGGDRTIPDYFGRFAFQIAYKLQKYDIGDLLRLSDAEQKQAETKWLKPPPPAQVPPQPPRAIPASTPPVPTPVSTPSLAPTSIPGRNPSAVPLRSILHKPSTSSAQSTPGGAPPPSSMPGSLPAADLDDPRTATLAHPPLPVLLPLPSSPQELSQASPPSGSSSWASAPRTTVLPLPQAARATERSRPVEEVSVISPPRVRSSTRPVVESPSRVYVDLSHGARMSPLPLVSSAADAISLRGAHTTPMQEDALFRAAELKDEATAIHLVKAGADVNRPGPKGKTALHLAAQHGLADLIRVLLAYGASVNAPSESGDSALHYACVNTSMEPIRLLTEAGANPYITNLRNITPVGFAAKKNPPAHRYFRELAAQAPEGSTAWKQYRAFFVRSQPEKIEVKDEQAESGAHHELLPASLAIKDQTTETKPGKVGVQAEEGDVKPDILEIKDEEPDIKPEELLPQPDDCVAFDEKPGTVHELDSDGVSQPQAVLKTQRSHAAQYYSNTETAHNPYLDPSSLTRTALGQEPAPAVPSAKIVRPPTLQRHIPSLSILQRPPVTDAPPDSSHEATSAVEAEQATSSTTYATSTSFQTVAETDSSQRSSTPKVPETSADGKRRKSRMVAALHTEHSNNNYDAGDTYFNDALSKLSSEEYPLHRAIKTKNLEQFQEAVTELAFKSTFNCDQEDNFRRPLLYLACRLGKESIAKRLLEWGANVNLPGPNGNTPLHAAAFTNRCRLVELLLEYNADRTIVNDMNLTPAELSANQNSAVACLLRADPEALTTRGPRKTQAATSKTASTAPAEVTAKAPATKASTAARASTQTATTVPSTSKAYVGRKNTGKGKGQPVSTDQLDDSVERPPSTSSTVQSSSSKAPRRSKVLASATSKSAPPSSFDQHAGLPSPSVDSSSSVLVLVGGNDDSQATSFSRESLSREETEAAQSETSASTPTVYPPANARPRSSRRKSQLEPAVSPVPVATTDVDDFAFLEFNEPFPSMSEMPPEDLQQAEPPLLDLSALDPPASVPSLSLAVSLSHEIGRQTSVKRKRLDAKSSMMLLANTTGFPVP